MERKNKYSTALKFWNCQIVSYVCAIPQLIGCENAFFLSLCLNIRSIKKNILLNVRTTLKCILSMKHDYIIIAMDY